MDHHLERRNQTDNPQGTSAGHRAQPTNTAFSAVDSNNIIAGGNVNMITAGGNVTVHASPAQPRREETIIDSRTLANWISPLNFYPIHKDTLEKVTPGTGTWIFEHPVFIDWLAKEAGTLWGTGIPGAGKTCLTSIVIEHLMALSQISNNSLPVIFVYCQYKDQLSTTQILAGLLKQLVNHSEKAFRHVRENLHARCLQTGTTPTRSELLKTLKAVVDLQSKVFIVIDALDELEEQVRHDVANVLRSLQQQLFMTSRPIPLANDFEPDLNLRAPSEDFQKLISAEIARLPRLQWILDAESQPGIMTQIEQKADGMLLLATLQLFALSNKGITNLASLLESIDELPTTLDRTYEMAVQRIASQNREEQDLAYRALLFVLHASRFLQVNELLEVLAVDLESAGFDRKRQPNENIVMSVCLGLLTIEKESNTVHLIHYTTQKFLEAQKTLSFIHPHTVMSNTAALYLSLSHPNFESIGSCDDLDEIGASHPFYAYAIRNLGYHTRLAISWSPNSRLPEHVGKLFVDTSSILLLPVVYGQEHYDHGNIVHFAAYYGLVTVFKESHKKLKKTFGQGLHSSPLFYACLGGRVSIVEEILAKQGPRASSKGVSGATALHAAVESGSSNIVDLLLHPKPFPLFSKSTLQHFFGGTSQVDVNARTNEGRTALDFACNKGHDQIVQQLLNVKDIDPTIAAENGWTPLHIASSGGHRSIIQLLLSTPGIDDNAKREDGTTALFIASQNGHECVVQLLLSVPRIDVNAKLEDGRTALWQASQNGHEPVAQLLLSTPGIDVNAKGIGGATALHVASQNGHEPVVQLLLSIPGIDVNAKREDGVTALHIASQNGHEPVVQLLLSTPGIDVNAKAENGETALYIASQNGHEPVVQLLLSTLGIDINAAGRTGATAFYIASEKGHKPVLQLLLSQDGIDVNAKASGPGRWTPLYGAAVSGHAKVVHFLLGCPGVDVHARTEEAVNGCPANETALQAARREGHNSVVTVFKEMGFDSTD